MSTGVPSGRKSSIGVPHERVTALVLFWVIVRLLSNWMKSCKEALKLVAPILFVCLMTLYQMAQRDIALKNCPFEPNWLFIILFLVGRQNMEV